MDTVYVETTVVGNIIGRLHPDPRISARQVVTRRWWRTFARKRRLLASAIVVSDRGDGDSSAARERLQVLEGIELLASSEAIDDLAHPRATSRGRR